MSKRRNQSGFTLIEMAVVTMLAGMVLVAAVPAVTAGKRILNQIQQDLAIQMMGDGVYDQMRRQLRDAGRIVIGTKEDLEQAAEIYPDLSWNMYMIPEEIHDFAWRIEIEHAEEEWMYLGMELLEDGKSVFERYEHVPMLNFGINPEGDHVLGSGTISGNGTEGIWYHVPEE